MGYVTVVMPTYNAEGSIKESIQGILGQTYPWYELIIVDDASKDSTAQIALEYSRIDSRIKVVILPKNKGPALARNEAIGRASGKYIAFCDADDIWFPSKLLNQMQLMGNLNCHISHSAFEVSGSKKFLNVRVPRFVSYQKMSVRNWIANSSGIYDASKLGKFYQSQNTHEDYEMWTSILKKGGFSAATDETLLRIYRGPGRLTSRRSSALLSHIQSQRRIFDQSAATLIFNLFKNLSWRLRNYRS
jgi:teichuronic acid biosynthesis glycosyltransferase TuaG